VVDYESRRRGSPICDLARKLVKAGYDPDTEIQIWRDSTLCFKPAPLRIWAKLRAVERDGRSVRFETWDAMPKGKAAALRAAQKEGLSGVTTRANAGASWAITSHAEPVDRQLAGIRG